MPSDNNDAKALFECRQCGKCCNGYGGTYVGDGDIQRIAEYVNMDPAGFVDKYCKLSGNRLLLAQRDDGYCVFWDQLCTIHPVKPLMCRKWPFLESILVDTANWGIMANSCPGIKTNLDYEMLKRFVKLMRSCNWYYP
jgi:hypothetical protein